MKRWTRYYHIVKSTIALIAEQPAFVFALQSLLSSDFLFRMYADRFHPEAVYTVKESTKNRSTTNLRKMAVVLHIYYEEHLERLSRDLRNIDIPFDLFITGSDTKKLETIRDELRGSLNINEITLIKSPNLGRNFGPLLCEVSKSLLSYEYLLHIHTKKSPQISNSKLRQWDEVTIGTLLNSQVVRRSVNILDEHPNIGLVYGRDPYWMRKINRRWLGNKYHAQRILNIIGQPLSRNFLRYPAGGMFLARVRAIEKLLEIPWEYSMFDAPGYQVDFRLEHAVERLIGEVAMSEGFEHCLFYPELDIFNTDSRHFRYIPFMDCVKILIGDLFRRRFRRQR